MKNLGLVHYTIAADSGLVTKNWISELSLVLRGEDIIETQSFNLEKDNVYVMAYVTPNRAKFLNYKIAILSGVTVEERLAKYLLMQCALTNSLEFPINSARLATRINCGRASLYRALDSLAHRGYISFETKKITVHSVRDLENM